MGQQHQACRPGFVEEPYCRPGQAEDRVQTVIQTNQVSGPQRPCGPVALGARAPGLPATPVWRDHGDLAAMASYERQYGVLGEGTLHGRREADGVAEITRQEIESTWATARETLDANRTEETN